MLTPKEVTTVSESFCFINNAMALFLRWPREVGSTLMEERVGRGAAFGDIDNDGDVDVVDQQSGW